MTPDQPTTDRPDRCPTCGVHLAPRLVAAILDPTQPETCPNGDQR